MSNTARPTSPDLRPSDLTGRISLDRRDFERERLLIGRLAVQQRGRGDEEQNEPRRIAGSMLYLSVRT